MEKFFLFLTSSVVSVLVYHGTGLSRKIPFTAYIGVLAFSALLGGILTIKGPSKFRLFLAAPFLIVADLYRGLTRAGRTGRFLLTRTLREASAGARQAIATLAVTPDRMHWGRIVFQQMKLKNTELQRTIEVLRAENIELDGELKALAEAWPKLLSKTAAPVLPRPALSVDIVEDRMDVVDATPTAVTPNEPLMTTLANQPTVDAPNTATEVSTETPVIAGDASTIGTELTPKTESTVPSTASEITEFRLDFASASLPGRFAFTLSPEDSDDTETESVPLLVAGLRADFAEVASTPILVDSASANT